MEVTAREVGISQLDHHFARFMAALAPERAGVYEAAALASMATRNGHSCLELEAWAGVRDLMAAGQLRVTPELEGWRNALAASPCVGSGPGNTPLVFEKDRLYLRRYWEYEEEVARGLLARGAASCPIIEQGRLAEGLRRYFPEASPGNDNQARLAALVAIFRPLAVITGGPGTGKTTTVARILALLAEQHLGLGKPLRIALAAPTGKAAMRLQESISQLKKGWRLPAEVVRLIPEQVMTVHRLLGASGAGGTFRYNENNPLPFDLVVVDEASMVDLPLMAKMFRALPRETRLILLGDRHQLSSVEPGSVLGDLCNESVLSGFSREFSRLAAAVAEKLEPVPCQGETFGLADSLVELRCSHRFASDSGIGRLGAAIKNGDTTGAWQVLHDQPDGDAIWHEVDSPGTLERSLTGLVPEMRAVLRIHDPGEALAAQGRLRVLCALRQGPFGAEQVNTGLEELITGRSQTVNYPGRPVMVLRNDYEQALYNGDVGITLADPEKENSLQVYFPAPDGAFRHLSPVRLPPHQSVYAMTVHKSQGSEFNRVILVLPERPSPVLSRELLFTAITRARSRVEIWGRRDVFSEAVNTSATRRSGLREKLWYEPDGPPDR